MEEKRNLYFQHSDGSFSLLKENCTEDEAFAGINKFLREHDFEHYYTRVWEKDGVKFFDVGSHVEFFTWTMSEKLKNEKIRNN